MSKVIKHHARLVMLAGMSLGQVETLPENPELSNIINYKGDVLIYTNFSGTAMWYPLVRGADTKTFRKVQAVSSLTWTVSHNMNTRDLIMLIKDVNGVEQENVTVTYSATNGDNEFTLTFAEPTAGEVFLVSMQSISSPEINTSVLNIGGKFVIDSAGITFNGKRVDLEALVELAPAIAEATAAAEAATNAATAAGSKADSAVVQASSASQAAGTAQSAANSAGNAAATADSKAVSAGVTAANADAKADFAALAASAADGKAVAAQTTATEAKSTADGAKVTAESALGLATNSPYDLGFGSDDPVIVGLNIGSTYIARKSRIPAYTSGTVVGKADVAATAATTFSVQRNGTQVALLSVGAGKTSITISGQVAIDLAVTDRVKILAVNADATLKGIDGIIMNSLQP